ncbi:MAG: glycine-rich protein, partial [Candidatus Cybelea sp.]
MRIFTLSHYTLSISGAAALLTGCGGLQVPTAARAASAATPSFRHDRFFSYTGGKQSFKVPAGVTHLTITAYGANGAWGGAGYSGYASSGGIGGTVTATIPVTPGERLAVFVGGNGGHDGFNGGGALLRSRCDCNGQGGGASDVRQGGDLPADRVVVAGGGGGGAINGSYGSYSTDGGGGGYGGREGGGGSDGSDELAGD